MRKWTMQELEEFGRIQLSPNFFMRDFLFSEISQIHGIPNLPSDPELAIQAGQRLCEKILEPLQDAWGRIAIRSAYRSEAVNQFGNESRLNCSRNEANYAAHIWDRRDVKGNMGATACIVIPAFLDYFRKTADWTALAWWIHDHIPDYHEMCFFTKNAAFNIRWYEDLNAPKTISSFVVNPYTGDKKALISAGKISSAYQGKELSQYYKGITPEQAASTPPRPENSENIFRHHHAQHQAKPQIQNDPLAKKHSMRPLEKPRGQSTATDDGAIEAQIEQCAKRLGMRIRKSSTAKKPNGYMVGKSNKTFFTVYVAGTDEQGYLEIAFNPDAWPQVVISGMQSAFGYAQPKASQKWPRAGFKRRYLPDVLCAIENISAG